MFGKEVCNGVEAKEDLIRFDKDGFVVNFKPGDGFQYSGSDFGDKTSSSQPIRKIRKLPNKQQWKVYYT